MRMADLEEKIREGEYSIEVRDTRMGKMAVLNKGGERTLDPSEQEELEELLEKYEDVVLELWNANEQLDDHERAWAMGEIYHEEVNESNERQIRTLNALLPFASEWNRQEYLFRQFYEMFLDQDYEETYAVMTLAELAQRAGPDEAREIYDNSLRDNDIDLRRDEVRIWAESSGPNLDEIAKIVVDKMTSPSVQNVKNIYRLHGTVDFPTDGEIEAALEKARG